MISLFFDSLGLLLAIGFVAYWCYSFRLLLDKEESPILKGLFLVMLFVFPAVTPAIIYVFYLDYFKKKKVLGVQATNRHL